MFKIKIDAKIYSKFNDYKEKLKDEQFRQLIMNTKKEQIK